MLIKSAVDCIRFFIYLVLRYVVTVVVCMGFMFCLMCASVMFLCVFMCGVFVVVECNLFQFISLLYALK